MQHYNNFHEPLRRLVEPWLGQRDDLKDLKAASYAGQCSPCRLLLSSIPLAAPDVPYDTARCIGECRGKWLPTLRVFLKYLLSRKLVPRLAHHGQIHPESIGAAVAIAVLASPRTHTVLGLVVARRMPDGSIDLPRPMGAIDRLTDRDFEIHLQLALRLRDYRDRSLDLSDIHLRRQTFNVTLSPIVTREVPALDIHGSLLSLRSYFPFEGRTDGTPHREIAHAGSLRNDVFVSWRPTVPILHARIYSKYGLRNPDWERYSVPDDARAVWHYLPHRAHRRARREDDLDVRDIDYGEISPRD